MTIETGSTFLPFYGSSLRFRNFALANELLGLIGEGVEFSVLTTYLTEKILKSFNPSGTYFMEKPLGGDWNITTLGANHGDVELDGFGFNTGNELHLASNHAIALAMESGNIGFSRTDGSDFLEEVGQGMTLQDSYGILILPLIDNLVPCALIVSVLPKLSEFTATDIELIAFLQILFSFSLYGGKPTNQMFYL